MFEFAAFGFVTLVWWTWPAIAGIVFGSMWAALWLHDLKQKREDKASGPYPCGHYMGTDISGQVDHWCWQREGHTGEHVNQWGVPQSDFEAEGKEEPPPPPVTLCTLAYECFRLDGHDGACYSDQHRVMDAGGHVYDDTVPVDGGLCRWGEDGDGNESACWKPAGHDGPHMVLDQPTQH